MSRLAFLSRRYHAQTFGLALLMGAVGVSVLPTKPAHAQDADQAESEAADAAKEAEARREAKRSAPPAALPGAQSNGEDNSHASGDMEPTAALFDAVNRGSLGAAKEAVNRGADMGGHNALGQTPLDLAIDLNRNNIIFYLLAMRNLEGSPSDVVTSVASSGVRVENGSGRMDVGGSAGRNTAASLSQRYDSSGGTPQPTAGFLGFGGS